LARDAQQRVLDLAAGTALDRRLPPLELERRLSCPVRRPNIHIYALLKGNAGKRRVRVPPEPARGDECPPPPDHLIGYAKETRLQVAPELFRIWEESKSTYGRDQASNAPPRSGIPCGAQDRETPDLA
jgi:hypothetical protein